MEVGGFFGNLTLKKIVKDHLLKLQFFKINQFIDFQTRLCLKVGLNFVKNFNSIFILGHDTTCEFFN